MGELDISVSASTLSFNSSSDNDNVIVNHGVEQQPVQPPPPPAVTLVKKRRNQPGMPDPEAEVVALSQEMLLATNRFVCEICGKGFQREQNLQLHRRGHNLPWKLRQGGPKEAVRKKRVYVCPEPGCVHHDPRRALGDLTGIKKHFSRKHGEKKWQCERCSKKYAVQSDWKAHLKTCGTRQYACDCGTIFSRRDSFVTHRAFCDALAQESAKVAAPTTPSANQSSEMQENTVGVATSSSLVGCSSSSTSNGNDNGDGNMVFVSSMFAPLSGVSPSTSQHQASFSGLGSTLPNSDRPPPYTIEPIPALSLSPLYQIPGNAVTPIFPSQEPNHQQFSVPVLPHPTMSATALLQKAAQIGATGSGSSLLCGLGLAVASPPSSRSMKTECGSPVSEGLGIEIPSDGDLSGSSTMVTDPSGFFGSKPMTLDFLGLGADPENSTAAAFPAYLNSIGCPIDIAAAFGTGCDAQGAQRKHNETLL